MVRKVQVSFAIFPALSMYSVLDSISIMTRVYAVSKKKARPENHPKLVTSSKVVNRIPSPPPLEGTIPLLYVT